RVSAINAVLTLTVCAAASAASVAVCVASAVACDALSAASLALIAAFLLLSSASRLRPTAVFRHPAERKMTPAAQPHTDSRRVKEFIDDLHAMNSKRRACRMTVNSK